MTRLTHKGKRPKCEPPAPVQSLRIAKSPPLCPLYWNGDSATHYWVLSSTRFSPSGRREITGVMLVYLVLKVHRITILCVLPHYITTLRQAQMVLHASTTVPGESCSLVDVVVLLYVSVRPSYKVLVVDC